MFTEFEAIAKNNNGTIKPLEDLLLRLENAVSFGAKEKLVRQFADSHSSPIIENGRVVFYYVSSEALTVALEGDWTSWKPTARMNLLSDTPLWYRAEYFPNNARVEYRVAVNGHPRLDPHNPRMCYSESGTHSEFIMPGYVPPSEITPNGVIPRVVVEQHWMKSYSFAERRTFWICYPPGYSPEKKYLVAYFNDGDGYLNYADFPRIMDYLIDTRQVKPFIAVLLKPNNRNEEYIFSSTYERFVNDELVPWVDDVYPTTQHRSARVIFGESLGALSAVYLAFRRPDLFGAVVGQSGDYTLKNDWILNQFSTSKNLKINFHFITAKITGARKDTLNEETLRRIAQRKLVALLREKGYLVSYAEYPEGHQWNFWRAHIGDALRFFWGTDI
jgi:enterochelin esterase-like enzyme